MAILERAKAEGLSTGIIIAPVFPPVRLRPDVREDLGFIFRELKRAEADYIYGECLHRRGLNMVYLEKALNEEIRLRGFDQTAGKIFYDLLREYGLKGEWWYELDGTGYYLEGERGP